MILGNDQKRTGKKYMKVMVGEMKVDSEGVPYTANRFTYEENKENLGKDLDIEVDGWSIKIEQRVEGEKITFSGDGNDFRKWLEKNWKEVHESYGWRVEQ